MRIFGSEKLGWSAGDMAKQPGNQIRIQHQQNEYRNLYILLLTYLFWTLMRIFNLLKILDVVFFLEILDRRIGKVLFCKTFLTPNGSVLQLSQEYSEPCQTSEIKHFVKIAKRSILEVWQASRYASVIVHFISLRFSFCSNCFKKWYLGNNTIHRVNW